jgi:glyoxylase-like metal-dependent hydrolase (beta-lactamase superfamily II)
MLRANGHTILVDTGVGGPTSPAMSWYPAPGQLMGSLAETGTSPGDVEAVLISHVHDDHIGGTVTAEGAPAFPNARYVINRIELEWQQGLAQEAGEDQVVWDRLLAPLESRGVLQAVDGAYGAPNADRRAG